MSVALPIIVAILAFFTGATFARCGCECHEDDGRDFEDEDPTREVEHG